MTLLLLSACIPAIPPATHFTPVVAVSATASPATSVDVSSLGPSLAVTHTRPVVGAPMLAGEVRVQAAIPHGQGGFALWLRTRGDTHQGGHFGVRLGADAGTGDIAGFLAWNMPHAGGSVHFQGAGGFGEGELGAWALTWGTEWQQPISPDRYSVVIVDSEGNAATVLPVPSLWTTLDTRVDLPIDQRVALTFGAGLQLVFILPVGLPVPLGSVSGGVRF